METTLASNDGLNLQAVISPHAAFRSLLASDFRSFIRYTFDVLRPGIEFKSNWHIDAMGCALQRVADGSLKKLIITVPPRNLKSICASVALPAWFLGHNPSERVVCVSYSDTLARSHAHDFRRVVNDPLYKSTFPRMRIERDTDREITTRLRGRRYATSVEGTLTGLGGNLFIVDDPIKAGDVFSEAARERTLEWYRSTLVTRPDDKKAARIVVVMQRVHERDLVGYLQEQGGFEVLNLPAVCLKHSEHLISLSPRRTYEFQLGEVLHPDHEPLEVLRDLKRSMGSLAFSAQYLQRPLPAGGTLIKSKWLKTYQSIGSERGDRMVISWDIALSENEKADFSAGVVLLNRGQTFYVLDVIRGRFPFAQLIKQIGDLCKKYLWATLLIEESPISIGAIQALRNANLNVLTTKPDRDKRARVISQTDLFEGGSILLPEKAAWLNDFKAELLAFPAGHDDQVDALVQGLAWQRAQWLRVVKQRIVRGGF